MRAVSTILVLFLLATSVASYSANLSCQACLEVAGVIERELFQPKPEEELEGPGRKLGQKFSEPEIFEALDSVCKKFGAGRDYAKDSCQRFLEPYKNDLEEYIFQNGITHKFRKFMCVQLTGRCMTHQLYDSGEL